MIISELLSWIGSSCIVVDVDVDALVGLLLRLPWKRLRRTWDMFEATGRGTGCLDAMMKDANCVPEDRLLT